MPDQRISSFRSALTAPTMPDAQKRIAAFRSALASRPYTQLYNRLTVPSSVSSPDAAQVYDLGTMEEIRRRAALEDEDSGLPKLASRAPMAESAPAAVVIAAPVATMGAPMKRTKKMPTLEEQAAALQSSVDQERADSAYRPTALSDYLNQTRYK